LTVTLVRTDRETDKHNHIQTSTITYRQAQSHADKHNHEQADAYFDMYAYEVHTQTPSTDG